MHGDEERFVEAVLRNSVNRAVVARGHLLGVPDWWLTAGAVFQTVWNVLDGRDPHAGIADYDLFYFDAADLSWEGEDAVIRRAAELFADLDGTVEVRNEARVHLWYEQHFGVPGVRFRSTADAVDHFASTTCCYALTSDPAGTVRVYAPHGYDDLFQQRVHPNPVLARARSTRRRPPAGHSSGRASRSTHGTHDHRALFAVVTGISARSMPRRTPPSERVSAR